MAERPAADELEAARARVAELEALDAERQRALDVQAALYRIADAASSAEDLADFYRTVHEIVGTLMRADNFYIALYDQARRTINFPYYVDTVDTDIPDPGAWEPFGVGNARGSTAYVLRTGRPALITPHLHEALAAKGELEHVGVVGEGDWLGVPLSAEGRTLGVLAVQGYTATETYTEADLDLLEFVGRHVGIALSRVRATDEARHRDAELVLVNEIGGALARQLDYEAIVELIGERLECPVRAALDVHRDLRSRHRDDLVPLRDRRRRADPQRVVRHRAWLDLAGDPGPCAPAPPDRRRDRRARGDPQRDERRSPGLASRS